MTLGGSHKAEIAHLIDLAWDAIRVCEDFLNGAIGEYLTSLPGIVHMPGDILGSLGQIQRRYFKAEVNTLSNGFENFLRQFCA